MYPGYEQYWGAVLANPKAPLPFSGKTATEDEIEYARFAAKTPHVVLSATLDRTAWNNTRIVRNIDDIRTMKQQAGKDMHAVGGATLVSSLVNAHLVDELRLVIQPIILGGGKALFKDVKERHAVKLGAAETLKGGAVRLTYST
jgi:dihydrofolate reductase